MNVPYVYALAVEVRHLSHQLIVLHRHLAARAGGDRVQVADIGRHVGALLGQHPSPEMAHHNRSDVIKAHNQQFVP
ncbi:MAG: hypothetical protein ACYC3A_10220 [Halothiobacillus sp.]